MGVLPTHYGVTTCILFLFFFLCAEGVCLNVCDLVIVWAEEVGGLESPCLSYIA